MQEETERAGAVNHRDTASARARIVMLVDLDSFYASLEERRRPELRGRAIVVCVFSGRTEDAGAVATADYRARALGIRAGMPIPLAKRLAGGRGVVFLPADREYYREVSERIMEILAVEADALEQVSIDEAYLEVTSRTGGSYEEAERIARRIRERIREEEGLTCSIGIGPNKFVAKMAAGAKKPDGLTIVREEEAEGFLAPLPVEELHGVGPRTAEALRAMGVLTCRDLARMDVQALIGRFGEARGMHLHLIAHGLDTAPVEARERTQLSRIATLKEDTRDPYLIMGRISELAGELEAELEQKGLSFRTLSIILIDERLRMFTKSETVPRGRTLLDRLPAIERLLHEWLDEHGTAMVRRVGCRVSNLSRASAQRTLAEFG